MAKIKKKIIKGLATFLLAGAFAFSPMKSKAQEKYRLIIDNFSQPNDTTLNYYGSGDINKDNIITWEDASRLDSLIQRTFTDSSDDRLTDRADIDGNGLIENQDKLDLEEFLITGDKTKIPGRFYNNLTKVDQNNLSERMEEIDKTDTLPFSAGCDHFAIPLTINFYGFESLKEVDPETFEWKFSKNGRFNIPLYYVATTTTSGLGHAINGGLFMGENPFDFYSWKFTEPSDDDDVHPGEWNMANNKAVSIQFFNIKDDGTASASSMITWLLDENGVPTFLEGVKTKYIVKSNPNKDTIPPEVSLTSPIDSNFYNSDVNLEYLVKENQTFLDTAYYELNGIRQYIACEVPATLKVNAPVDSISATIPLTSEEGEHNFMFYASDIAKPQGNETIINRYFVIDKTNPEITASINHIEGTDSAEVAINVSETNPDYARYSYNGSDWNYFSSDTSFTKKLEQGENILNVEAKDKATNYSQTQETLNFIPDAVENLKTLENYFKTYPNPVEDILRFENIKDARIEVYDIAGKQLERRFLEGNEFDMSNYKPGMYLIKTKDRKGKIYTNKIIKK